MDPRYAFTLIAASALTIGLRQIREADYLIQRHELKVYANVRAITSRLEAWGNHDFTFIYDEHFKGNLVNAVNNRAPRELTPDQRSRLAQKMWCFFECNRNPTFETFLQFRAGSLPYKIEFNGKIDKLAKFHERNGIQLAEKPLDRFKQLWELVLPTDSKGRRPWITAVSVGDMGITVERITGTNTLTQRRAVGNMTLCVTPMPAPIVYLDDYKPTHIPGATNLFAEILFLAKVSNSQHAGPFALCWFWSDRVGDWVPWELFFDAQTSFHTIF